MKTSLNVKGMICGHCKAAVESAVEKINGVQNVEVDLSTGKVAVTYDDSKVKADDISEAIEDQGYDVKA